MTSDKRNLATVEQLKDPRTEIEVASLKFWRKSLDDFTDFSLTYFVHLGRLDGKASICELRDG